MYPLLQLSLTRIANSGEQDGNLLHRKIRGVPCCIKQYAVRRNRDIAYTSAFPAQKVRMLMCACVIAVGFAIHMKPEDDTRLGKLIEIPIHGAKTDIRQIFSDILIHNIRSRMVIS